MSDLQVILSSVLEYSRILSKVNFFKVYNGYERFEFYEIPKCGHDFCELPIIEIGSSELVKDQLSLKPKLLITAGLDGTEDVSISVAMNFLRYVGTRLARLELTNRIELHERFGGASTGSQFPHFRGADGLAGGGLPEKGKGGHFWEN